MDDFGAKNPRRSGAVLCLSSVFSRASIGYIDFQRNF